MDTTKKTYSFYATNLTNKKYNELVDKINVALDCKNHISAIFYSDLTLYLNMSKHEFMSKLLPELKNIETLNGQDKQNVLSEVYTMYSNRYMTLDFTAKLHKKIKRTFYKIGPNKGKIKEVKITRRSTKLTKVVSYLTKTGYNKEVVEHLLSQDLDEKPRIFFNDVLFYINKFGSRLFNLTNQRRKRLLEDTKIINFTNKTYRSVDQSGIQIVKENKNKRSKIKAFISIGPFSDRSRLHIPTKVHSKHHGDLKAYGSKNAPFIVKLEDNGKIRIILTRDCPKYRPINDLKSTIGVDINVKNNLFSLSTGEFIDYDRPLINGYIKFLKKVDKTKSRKEEFHGMEHPNLSKKDREGLDNWLVRMNDMFKRKARELVDLAKQKGIKTIVLEDLELMNSSMVKSLEYEGFKYSRLVRLLHLGSMKHVVRSIANKEGIDVIYTNPAYTSQECSSCGSIDKGNRKNQETYSCKCGLNINADYNASLNIRNRVSNNRLFKLLHVKNKDGFIESKPLTYYNIKGLIEEVYAST